MSQNNCKIFIRHIKQSSTKYTITQCFYKGLTFLTTDPFSFSLQHKIKIFFIEKIVTKENLSRLNNV